MCVLCQNIASIVDTSQVIDEVLANYLGNTKALRVYPGPLAIVDWNRSLCPSMEEETCDPFNSESGAYILSAGYCLAMLIFGPLCFLDLKVSIDLIIQELFQYISSVFFSYSSLLLFYFHITGKRSQSNI